LALRYARDRVSLYDDPDLYDALLPIGAPCIDFYVGLAREQAGDVLELACGTGQLLVPLATTGLHVSGLDNAPTMLEAARRRAATPPPATTAPAKPAPTARASTSPLDIDLQLGDMRTFTLSRRFSLIVIARNSLLHLHTADDLIAALATARAHLAAGGMLAFDVFNPNLALLARPAGQRTPLMTVTTAAHGDITVEQTSDYDAVTQVQRGTWFVSTSNDDNISFPLHLRSIFPQELPLLVHAAGLGLVSRFGNYAREPFESTSPRQVCIARAR
jgi:SAM-dependent methyltransferase